MRQKKKFSFFLMISLFFWYHLLFLFLVSLFCVFVCVCMCVHDPIEGKTRKKNMNVSNLQLYTKKKLSIYTKNYHFFDLFTNKNRQSLFLSIMYIVYVHTYTYRTALLLIHTRNQLFHSLLQPDFSSLFMCRHFRGRLLLSFVSILASHTSHFKRIVS